MECRVHSVENETKALLVRAQQADDDLAAAIRVAAGQESVADLNQQFADHPPVPMDEQQGGEITSSTITATSRETSAPTAFRAPIMTAAADSNSSDPKDQAIDCGSNPRATDYQTADPDSSSCCSFFLVLQPVWSLHSSGMNSTIPVYSR
jgi:hypothetical protein